MNFKEIMVNWVLPMASTIGKAQLTEVFEKFYLKDPKACEIAMTSITRPIETYLIPLAEDSATKVDDVAVDIIVSSIHAVAANHGIVLPVS